MKRLVVILLLAASSVAAQSKQEIIVTSIQAATTGIDYGVTRININHGDIELNPYNRPFVHNNYSMAGYATSEVALAAFVGHKMKNSRHRWIRDIWWAPQAYLTYGHVYGAIFSFHH